MSNDRHIRQIVQSELATFFMQTTILRCDESDRPEDTVRGFPDPEDPQGSPGDQRMQRVEPYGVILCAPAQSPALLWQTRAGGAVLPLGSPRYRPQSVGKSGNTGLYTDSGIVVLLHGKGSADAGAVEISTPQGANIIIEKGGAIRITAKAGQDLTFNGGTLQVARKTDAVGASADFTAWAGAVGAALAGLGAPVGAPPTTVGAITGGAANVKA